MLQITPLQQKPTPPTWQIEGPFSELAFTYAGAGADSEAQTVTQNFENSQIYYFENDPQTAIVDSFFHYLIFPLFFSIIGIMVVIQVVKNLWQNLNKNKSSE